MNYFVAGDGNAAECFSKSPGRRRRPSRQFPPLTGPAGPSASADLVPAIQFPASLSKTPAMPGNRRCSQVAAALQTVFLASK